MLEEYFDFAHRHKAEHQCTGVPYEEGELLSLLVSLGKAKRLLEIGCGTGYSSACLLNKNTGVVLDAVDVDSLHLDLALRKWEEYSLTSQIKVFCLKAEDFLIQQSTEYDLIFFDANTPQRKFITHFKRLLRTGGLLVTANLFLKDSKGGKYLAELKQDKAWQTVVLGGTAISQKIISR